MSLLEFLAKEWQFTFLVGYWIYWMCDLFLDARECQGCGHCNHCEHQECLEEYGDVEGDECDEHEFCWDDAEEHEAWVTSTEFPSCDREAACGNHPVQSYTVEWCDWCEEFHSCTCVVKGEGVKEDRPKHPQVAPTPTLPAPTNHFGSESRDR